MASNRPLAGDIKVTGMDQKSLYQWMANVTDLLNELQTDHATVQLAVDGIVAKIDADEGITDTDYEAIHGVAGSGAALPATLSNSTAITLLKA